VREFFPDTFRTAYRQRARWTLGIGLQGWKQTGWSGSLANRYLLFRDRKGIVTAFVGILAYALVIQFLAFAGADLLGFMPQLIASPFSDSDWLQALLWINGCALLLRAGQRAYFVTRLYGWEHGVLSVPRMVVGNFINFMAVSRAWKLFVGHLVTGKRLAWDKTMHDFPSADGFTNRRQRLGELLLSWQAIDADKLEQALGESHAREAPLGRVLMAKGWLDEETLAEAIAFQADLPRGRLDVTRVTQDAVRLPLETIVRYRVLPQVERTDVNDAARATADASVPRPVVLLTASPLAEPVLAELGALAGGPIVQRIVREGEIAAGLRVLRGVDVAASASAASLASSSSSSLADVDASAIQAPARSVPLIGDLLIEHGHVRREAFEAAMQHYRPDRHGRIGDYMVACEVISRAALDNVIQQQRRLHGELTASE
jgi:adsorption protein B